MSYSLLLYHKEFQLKVGFIFFNQKDIFQLEFPHVFNAISAARAMSKEFGHNQYVIAATNDTIRKPRKVNSRKRELEFKAAKVYVCCGGEIELSFKIRTVNSFHEQKRIEDMAYRKLIYDIRMEAVIKNLDKETAELR